MCKEISFGGFMIDVEGICYQLFIILNFYSVDIEGVLNVVFVLGKGILVMWCKLVLEFGFYELVGWVRCVFEC